MDETAWIVTTSRDGRKFILGANPQDGPYDIDLAMLFLSKEGAERFARELTEHRGEEWQAEEWREAE